ncbi:cellulase [Herbaspirillum sp. LeCh32-8]|uniref:cellulose synthase complex periplasmic endoglucanase BcsZ n=1 Tax=Herbaspirillum sp. LeCh32-8 TaxID=2821356 RepID=UPI001AE34767|nr:cellulose synthase complex periplasmic endoglucanase BcsZ [Herbaspirillum sp. LeCh32-8]MBP0599857.1 cellulase [Herbaspirillum sp. LeCh32-8]
MTPYFPKRRLLLQAGAALALVSFLPALATDAAAQSCPAGWPQWEAFARRHVQADGRIVDFSVPEQQSTSESQSYGMFFALVADDRARFAAIWRWSRDNLGAGSDKLPAWHWGRREGGSFGVIDPNSAADADLWFAYALLEASRLWQMPEYLKAGMALLNQVKAQEVRTMGELGPMLLPGPYGFDIGRERWRLNPSYLPLPLLRRFAAVDPSGPWSAMAQGAAKLITQSAPQGFAPDWVIYDAAKGFQPDSERSVLGSYDAIRVYLWAGVTDDGDALVAAIRNALAPMTRAIVNYAAPPENINSVTGAPQGRGPVGFSAAVLPWLKSTGAAEPLAAQEQLVRDKWTAWSRAVPHAGAAGDGEFNYYNSVLTLFGWGWLQGQYRFDAAGNLSPAWACKS